MLIIDGVDIIPYLIGGGLGIAISLFCGLCCGCLRNTCCPLRNIAG